MPTIHNKYQFRGHTFTMGIQLMPQSKQSVTQAECGKFDLYTSDHYLNYFTVFCSQEYHIFCNITFYLIRIIFTIIEYIFDRKTMIESYTTLIILFSTIQQ